MSEDTRLDRASTPVPSLHARFRSRRGWRTSASGTFETCWHVRSMVAIRGIADIEKAVLYKRVSSHKYAP
jgi:hypothetical protein